MNGTIIFILRKSQAFSIEKVFSVIIVEMKRIGVKCEVVKLPSDRDSIFGVIRNLLFILILKIRKNDSILHITGDNHYLAMIMNPNRMVLTIHDNIKIHIYHGLKKRIAKLLWITLPVEHSKVITTISNSTKKEVIKLTKCDPTKINVIHNPIDPLYQKSKKEFNSDKPRILHLGTKINKNIANLIKALADVNCILIIVGKLKQSDLLLLEECQIEFLNFEALSNEEIHSAYNDCDIVSFITLYEGFGMPIIEAQSVGKPVITSSLEPHREIAGEFGAVFVDPTDISQIRSGIKAILTDEQLRTKLIEYGFENIKKYYVEKIAEEYIQVYRRMGFVLENN